MGPTPSTIPACIVCIRMVPQVTLHSHDLLVVILDIFKELHQQDYSLKETQIHYLAQIIAMGKINQKLSSVLNPDVFSKSLHNVPKGNALINWLMVILWLGH